MLKYLVLSLILVASTLAAKIVGGFGTDIKNHPYQVSLELNKNNSGYRHVCGGSIIKENCILTAAHCVVDFRAAGSWMIAAGTNKRNDPDAVRVPAQKIIMHGWYDKVRDDYDVALIFLAEALPINNETIATIALETQAPTIGSSCSVTGWGATSSGGYASNQLLQVNVPIIPSDRCNKAYTLIYGYSRITSRMFCAGFEGVGGRDSCQGDSGGPLICNGKQAGVVSWGYECGRSDAPGVYANVADLYNWITQRWNMY